MKKGYNFKNMDLMTVYDGFYETTFKKLLE